MQKNSTEEQGWSLTTRIIVSGFLIIHILAVFMPPFTFATSSGPGNVSPFAAPLMRLVKPYTDVMYLDHGYFFFAPNPGPSHLLKATLEFSKDQPTRELEFPDRKQQWPRLLYHRHFMLAEQLHSDFVPPRPPPDLDPESLSRWQRARDLYVRKRDSFAEHLRTRYGAEKVTLARVEHQLMSPGEFVDLGDRVNSSDRFVVLPEELP